MPADPESGPRLRNRGASVVRDVRRFFVSGLVRVGDPAQLQAIAIDRDPYHVETHRDGFPQSALDEPCGRRSNDLSLLVAIDRFEGRAPVGAGPRAHFDEDVLGLGEPPVDGDEIDLGTGTLNVAFEHAQALVAKVLRHPQLDAVPEVTGGVWGMHPLRLACTAPTGPRDRAEGTPPQK